MAYGPGPSNSMQSLETKIGALELEESIYGCSHYRRKCKLVCPNINCSKAYICRFCHDDKETHLLDRYNVRMLVCLVCNELQAVRSECRRCYTVFGQYFCRFCNLFTDEDQHQYHCKDCGLCRVGPQSNFFHCKRCDLCLSVDLRGRHKCVEKASQSECPLCCENMHTSRSPLSVLPCGHLIHGKCLKELLQKDHHLCPVCRDPIPAEKYNTSTALPSTSKN